MKIVCLLALFYQFIPCSDKEFCEVTAGKSDNNNDKTAIAERAQAKNKWD